MMGYIGLSMLQDVLWDYIPKQRKVVDIPGVDSKAWQEEAKLQLQNYAVTHFIGEDCTDTSPPLPPSLLPLLLLLLLLPLLRLLLVLSHA